MIGLMINCMYYWVNYPKCAHQVSALQIDIIKVLMCKSDSEVRKSDTIPYNLLCDK